MNITPGRVWSVERGPIPPPRAAVSAAPVPGTVTLLFLGTLYRAMECVYV